MNSWTQRSIELANQQDYLDRLFSVYPLYPDVPRTIDEDAWKRVEKNFSEKSNENLIRELLRLDLFPIKDSYVAYLRRDREAIERNPRTVARICERLYKLGIDELKKLCEAPKETNRQIGPLFRRWLQSGSLGLPMLSIGEFSLAEREGILNAGDAEAARWCRTNLDYKREKGLDVVARVRGKIVIGEAKFLTDFGGHQNAQMDDALSTLRTPIRSDLERKVVKIVVADGVCYISKGKNKLYKQITEENDNIMSALCLRDFLHSL